MVRETGCIISFHSQGHTRIIRAKEMIQKIKNRLKRKTEVSIRKLVSELNISNESVVRMLKQDLGYRSHKKRVEDMLRVIFSGEKMFDLDGSHNAQNN